MIEIPALCPACPVEPHHTQALPWRAPQSCIKGARAIHSRLALDAKRSVPDQLPVLRRHRHPLFSRAHWLGVRNRYFPARCGACLCLEVNVRTNVFIHVRLRPFCHIRPQLSLWFNTSEVNPSTTTVLAPSLG